MTRRSWTWLGIVGVLAAVEGGFTLNSTLTWKPQPGGPADGTLGQLVGWFTFTILVVWLTLILIGAARSARERRRMTSWSLRGTDDPEHRSKRRDR